VLDAVDFPACLAATGAVERRGLFARTRACVPVRPSEQAAKVLVDELAGVGLSCGSIAVPVESAGGALLNIPGSRPLAFRSDAGLVVQHTQEVVVFPAQPRFLRLDRSGRITEWKPLAWEVRVTKQGVEIAAHAPGAGWIEFVWLHSCETDETFAAELLSYQPIEQQAWAVEGCWSTLQGLREFFDFWALGEVYNGRAGDFGRFPSGQTAWSLYKIASVLADETGKTLYKGLMAALAFASLLGLNEEGFWANGEWLEEMETHLRLQVDGIHLLLSGYELFQEEAFLEGAERAAAGVIRLKDELGKDEWWFLHDTLELDESALLARYPSYQPSEVFRKKRSNTLTLNTHVNTLTVLSRLVAITGKSEFQHAYAAGMAVLEKVLGYSKCGAAHRIAEWLLGLSFENRNASSPRRALRHLVRTRMINRLTWVRRFWPRFVTPGGYLWRDMGFPNTAYWYHLVNLYDLIALCRVDPQPWLRTVIDRGMAYTKRSNLVEYLLAQHHYILPQWLQILKAYASLGAGSDQSVLQGEWQRLREHGYGIPPELYKPDGSFWVSGCAGVKDAGLAAKVPGG
jgi:hypothetical protein